MSPPTVSVTIPNYNHGHWLPRCLASILGQSRLPDEIIICDDASSDNSLQVMEDFARRSPIIRVIRNEKNCGVLLTIRRLIKESQGELVMAMGADDEMCAGFIEHMHAAAARFPETGLFVANVIFRRVDDLTGKFSDHMLSAGRTIVLSPQEVRAAPGFLDHCLPNGYSSASMFRKAAMLEALELSHNLGPQSDTLERLFVASKYGACFLDVPGLVFHLMPGAYSNVESLGSALAGANWHLEMHQRIQQPDLLPYFPPPLLSKLSSMWGAVAWNNVDRQISGAYRAAEDGFEEAFEKTSLSGARVGKWLLALSRLWRTPQRWWMRRCIKRAFVPGGHGGSRAIRRPVIPGRPR